MITKLVLCATPDKKPIIREIEIGYDENKNPYTERTLRERVPTDREIDLFRNGYGRMVKF